MKLTSVENAELAIIGRFLDRFYEISRNFNDPTRDRVLRSLNWLYEALEGAEIISQVESLSDEL